MRGFDPKWRDVPHFILGITEEIWEDRGIASLGHRYAPGGRGWSDADRFWMGLRAAFPDAAFRIKHVIGRYDARMPPRAALRWSLYGKHSGWRAFGTLSVPNAMAAMAAAPPTRKTSVKPSS